MIPFMVFCFFLKTHSGYWRVEKGKSRSRDGHQGANEGVERLKLWSPTTGVRSVVLH